MHGLQLKLKRLDRRKWQNNSNTAYDIFFNVFSILQVTQPHGNKMTEVASPFHRCKNISN